MLKNKKLLIVLSTLMVLSLVLTACGTSTPDGDDTGNAQNELIIAQGADAKSLDPHGTNDQPSSRVSKQIYNTLVTQNEDMELVPGLAEDWEQVDDTTWEFTLRQGVKFHNGEELKASDVKFTFERMLASDQVAHIIEAVDSVEAPEDYKVVIKLKEPFGPLLAHLSHTASSILNEKAVTEAGEDYGQSPVGTGPYKFSNWQTGDKIELVAHEDYFEGAPSIEKVTFRNITEGTNRAIALETGEAHIAYDIEPIDKEQIKNTEGLDLVEEPSLSLAYIGFNVDKKPFDNKEVRQAINYAINRDDIISAVLNGAGEKAGASIGPKVVGHNPEVKPYDFDVEKAKELLKEAGYENGFDTTIWTNDNPVRVQIAQIVQAQLKEIGINAEIETLEWGSYLDRTAQGEHDMFILGWVAVTGDADYGLYAVYHSSAKGGAGNRTFFDNARVDELLEAGRKSIDVEEREGFYHEAQEIIADEAPGANLYYQTQNIGISDDVEGFRMHPAGHHRVYGASFK